MSDDELIMVLLSVLYFSTHRWSSTVSEDDASIQILQNILRFKKKNQYNGFDLSNHNYLMSKSAYAGTCWAQVGGLTWEVLGNKCLFWWNKVTCPCCLCLWILHFQLLCLHMWCASEQNCSQKLIETKKVDKNGHNLWENLDNDWPEIGVIVRYCLLSIVQHRTNNINYNGIMLQIIAWNSLMEKYMSCNDPHHKSQISRTIKTWTQVFILCFSSFRIL